jgi:hypothetical protein
VESVYSAVRTESLYKTDKLRLYGVNSSLQEVSGQSHAAATSGEEAPIPADWKAGRALIRCRRFGEGNQISDPVVCRVVAWEGCGIRRRLI